MSQSCGLFIGVGETQSQTTAIKIKMTEDTIQTKINLQLPAFPHLHLLQLLLHCHC